MHFIAIAITLFAAILPVSEQPKAPQYYPPPGRLIQIGSRQLHLDCTGHGNPTVILVSGGDAYSIDWALVQPRIAQRTRVCSYDRAGLGWSDPGPADETVEQTVADLHALLTAAGEKRPYILVGASVGGSFIRAYQRAFPEDVAALVFSNSANHIGLNVKGKTSLIWDLTEEEIRSAYPLPPSNKGPEPTHEGKPFDRLPRELQSVRLWLDQRLWKSWNPVTAKPEMVLSWRKEFLREFDEVNGSTSPILGKLPVNVISSNPVLGRDECHSHSNAAACLDFLSTNSVHITATGSGHEIHLYQPDTVVRAILMTLSAVRNGVPLSVLPRPPS